jgi:hypothetical protein
MAFSLIIVEQDGATVSAEFALPSGMPNVVVDIRLDGEAVASASDRRPGDGLV